MQKSENITSFTHSELVLNSDDSVYHLNLLPEEVAETIILVGDPKRVAEVSRHFDQIDVKKSKREFVTHTGRIGNKRLSVVGTGIGAGNIDIAMNELDALFNIDLKTRSIKKDFTKLQFIRLGTSGALHPDIPVESCVISAFGIGLDAFVNYYDWQPNVREKQLCDHAKIVFAKQAFAQSIYAAEGAKPLLQQFACMGKLGITLTCPGFYGAQGRQLRVKLADADYLSQAKEISLDNLCVTNLEMETAAIYGMARLLNHDACSISTILANRELKTFSENPQRAIDAMIAMALSKL